MTEAALKLIIRNAFMEGWGSAYLRAERVILSDDGGCNLKNLPPLFTRGLTEEKEKAAAISVESLFKLFSGEM